MDVIAVPIIFGFFVCWKVFKGRKVGGWVGEINGDGPCHWEETQFGQGACEPVEFMAENIFKYFC